LKWIRSHDLRLIPVEFFDKCSNPHINREAFFQFAGATVGNPYVFCLYGLDKDGRVTKAVKGFYDLLDGYVYVSIFFNDTIFKDIQEFIKETIDFYKAKGVKEIIIKEHKET